MGSEGVIYPVFAHSNLLILQKFRDASIKEHKWYMQERSDQPVTTTNAEVDWRLRGYEARLYRAFKTDPHRFEDALENSREGITPDILRSLIAA